MGLVGYHRNARRWPAMKSQDPDKTQKLISPRADSLLRRSFYPVNLAATGSRLQRRNLADDENILVAPVDSCRDWMSDIRITIHRCFTTARKPCSVASITLIVVSAKKT
jgi:hypothetical protein